MPATQDMGKCPLCGYVGKRKAKSGNNMDFTAWKPGDPVILVQEMQGGKIPGTGRGYRGSAKPVPPRTIETYTLDDLVKQGIYPDYVDDLKNQVLVVVRELIRLGVIKKSMI